MKAAVRAWHNARAQMPAQSNLLFMTKATGTNHQKAVSAEKTVCLPQEIELLSLCAI